MLVRCFVSSLLHRDMSSIAPLQAYYMQDALSRKNMGSSRQGRLKLPTTWWYNRCREWYGKRSGTAPTVRIPFTHTRYILSQWPSLSWCSKLSDTCPRGVVYQLVDLAQQMMLLQAYASTGTTHRSSAHCSTIFTERFLKVSLTPNALTQFGT